MARSGLQRRVSPLLVVLTIAMLMAGIASIYLLLRNAKVQSLFRSDTDNAAEASQLQSASLTVATNTDASDGWRQWFGPQRDGRAPAGPFRTDWDKRPPIKIWEAPCGQGFSSLAIVGGKLYIHDRDGGSAKAANERVRCLDAATGKALWNHEYIADYSRMDAGYATGPRATVAVDGNRIYAVGAVGALICLQAPETPDGKPRELWRHDLLAEFDAKPPQWGIACSPLIEGDVVVVQPGGKHGSVAAFDKVTGELRWKAGDNPSGYSSPIACTVSGTRVILAMTGNALLCLGVDGKLLDSYKWVTEFNGNIATPLVVGDYVFISSNYSHGCALLHATKRGEGVKLEEVYFRNNKVMRNHHSNCVFKDGYLYGFDQDDLKCIDFRRGREQPNWEAKDLRKGCLILKDKHLIVLTQGGDLALVEATPEDYTPIAKLPSGLSRSNNWSLPVLVDGRLYLRDEQKLICLDVK